MANLNSPDSVAISLDGDVYIADTSNHRLRKVRKALDSPIINLTLFVKVTSAGIIITVAGTGIASFGGDGGAATAATLNSPRGVAVSSFGVVFFVDSGNSRIRQVSLNFMPKRRISFSGTDCFEWIDYNNCGDRHSRVLWRQWPRGFGTAQQPKQRNVDAELNG